MTDVTQSLKDKQPCPCDKDTCTVYGVLLARSGHVRGCGCRKCIAGRNSRQGKAAHRRIARELGAATPGRGASSHEESWVHAWRLEVKTGAQAGPVVTRFNAAKAQSEQSRAYGDHKPFAAIFDPRRKGEPTVVCMELEMFKAMTLIAQEVTA
jgi:hypothetical protein